MLDLLLTVLLPCSIAGSVFLLLLAALHPLKKQMSGRQVKMALATAALLFALPLAPAVQLGNTALATGPAQNTAMLTNTLQNTPATAPAFAVGRALRQTAAPKGQSAPQHTPAQPSGAEKPAASLAAGPGFVLVAVYLLGFLACGVYYTAQYCSFASRLRGSLHPPTQEAAALYKGLCHKLGIKRAPAFMQSAAVQGPLLFGLLRPVVVLPAGTLGTPQKYALRHELTHYKHRDIPCKLVVLCLCTLHWFNPFVYLLRSQFAAACEQACDEALTRDMAGTARKEYAAALLHYAQRTLPYAAAGFAQPVKQLKKRLHTLLHPKCASGKARAAFTAVLSVAAAACLLAGCSIAAGASAQSAPNTAPPNTAASVLPASSPASSLAPASSAAGGAANIPSIVPPVPQDALHDGAGYLYSASSGAFYQANFIVPPGTPVVAVAAGVVETAEEAEGGQRTITVNHGADVISHYGNCGEFFVQPGQSVAQGDVLAEADTAADDESKAHCTLRLRAGEQDIDLQPYFAQYFAQLEVATKSAPDGKALFFPVPDGTHNTRGFAQDTHEAIDIIAPEGTPIYAADDGVVTTATSTPSYGHYVEIQYSTPAGWARCTLIVQA